MDKYNYTNFLVSDIHSFYFPLKSSLYFAGFNKKDKTHRLIILGDLFDRGPDTLEVYKFIKSLPKHRRVLIKGNHEQLYFELLKKDFPDDYDFSNGTVRTFCSIAKVDLDELNFNKICKSYYEKNETPPLAFIRAKIHRTWQRVQAIVAEHEITKWLSSNEWHNYFELDELICVHSFIPVTRFGAMKNWREAHNSMWEDAMWGCPWKDFKAGLFNEEAKQGKKLVCGHWHAQDFNRVFKNEPDNWEVYLGDNLIAIDGCCATTGNILVLKVTSEGYFDRYNKKIGERT